MTVILQLVILIVLHSWYCSFYYFEHLLFTQFLLSICVKMLLYFLRNTPLLNLFYRCHFWHRKEGIRKNCKQANIHHVSVDKKKAKKHTIKLCKYLKEKCLENNAKMEIFWTKLILKTKEQGCDFVLITY